MIFLSLLCAFPSSFFPSIFVSLADSFSSSVSAIFLQLYSYPWTLCLPGLANTFLPIRRHPHIVPVPDPAGPSLQQGWGVRPRGSEFVRFSGFSA